MKETTSEWELLNDVKAIWLRNPKEVTDDEYTKFYHSLAKVICLEVVECFSDISNFYFSSLLISFVSNRTLVTRSL